MIGGLRGPAPRQTRLLGRPDVTRTCGWLMSPAQKPSRAGTEGGSLTPSRTLDEPAVGAPGAEK